MKMKKSFLPALLVLAALAGGCQTSVYHVVQPPGVPQAIADEPVTIHNDPLDYRLARRGPRLSLSIINPTDDDIRLMANRSYVVDPEGESHPLRGRIIAPHSHVNLLLPPVPLIFPYESPGWGWGWGAYWDPFYDEFYGPPAWNYEVFTQYDWVWKTGAARLHLGYERGGHGGGQFEHHLELDREPAK